MSIFDQTDFAAEASDDDILQPSDMMGSDSVANQSGGPSGLTKGSATRSLVVLWFSAMALKWILAYVFRGNIKG